MPFTVYLQSMVDQHDRCGGLSPAALRQCLFDLLQHHEFDLAEAVKLSVSAAVQPLQEEIDALSAALLTATEGAEPTEYETFSDGSAKHRGMLQFMGCVPKKTPSESSTQDELGDAQLSSTATAREDTGAGVWEWLSVQESGADELEPDVGPARDGFTRGRTHSFLSWHACGCCSKSTTVQAELKEPPLKNSGILTTGESTPDTFPGMEREDDDEEEEEEVTAELPRTSTSPEFAAHEPRWLRTYCL